MRLLVLTGLAALTLSAPAFANPAPSGDMEQAWGGDNFETPINPQTRDANGNRLIVNGQIMTDSTLTGGIGDGFSSGAGAAQAVGNQLNVVTQGNWNTVIVNSNQTNTGDISANTNGVQ